MIPSPTAETSGAPVAASDLEIRVRIGTVNGRPVLDYVLHSPSQKVPFHYTRIPGPEMVRPPEEFHRDLRQQIEKLGDGLDVDDEALLADEIRGELEELGRALYRELFPVEMRLAYRRFRGVVETMLITSDEPWIPWELIKPFDASDPDEIINDDFLCIRFQLGRWLAGEIQPGTVIRLRRLAHVEAAEPAHGPALSAGTRERDALAELARRESHVELIRVEPRHREVMKLIRSGNVDLVHFTGHGDASAERPDEARLILAASQALRARSLDGPDILAIKKRRPLVFLNACRAAQQGWVLTGLGGWAEAWVRRCECSAFLGPQWSVRDDLAGEFASTFYQALGEGETIGRATQRARQHVRKLRPGDPTWLAYVVYAHPGALGALGAAASTSAEPSPSRPEHRQPQKEQDIAPPEVVRNPLQPERPSSLLGTWLRALRGAAVRSPLGSGVLAVALITALLVAGCILLGNRTHEARESLIDVEGLSYPVSELLRTGVRVIVTLPWKGLHALLVDHGPIRWGSVVLLLMMLGWMAISLLRSPTRWLVSALAVTAVTLTVGSTLYTFAVRASNLEIRGSDSFLRVPELSGNLKDQIAFETASWLRNDSPSNANRREAVNGLMLWLLLATGAGIWAGASARGLRPWTSPLRWILVGVHLLVLGFLLDKLPHAHAMAEWGLKYPRVLAADCDEDLTELLGPGECLVYDVSAGARERKLKSVGTCALKRDTVVAGCDPQLGSEEVIGSVPIQPRSMQVDMHESTVGP